MNMRYSRFAFTLAIVTGGFCSIGVQANGIYFEDFSASSNTAQAFGGAGGMLPLMMFKDGGGGSIMKELLVQKEQNSGGSVDFNSLVPILMGAEAKLIDDHF